MSGLVFEKLTQALGAGEVWRLIIGADFFRIAAADWALKVRVLKAGRILGEMDGWQAGDYLRGVEFDAVEVENGATAQTVTVQIAGGGVGSDRVIGEVSVIDGAVARTKAGTAFFGGVTATAAAGFYSAVEIWNPVGSGKNIIISKAVVGVSVECKAYMRGMTSAFATDVTAFGSKMIGGAAPVATFKRSIAEATIPGTPLILIPSKAGAAEWIEFREPVVIGPGYGLVAVPNIVNCEVTFSVEFNEQDI